MSIGCDDDDMCAGCDGAGATCLECGEPEPMCNCDDAEFANCMYCFGRGSMPPQREP